MKNKKSESMKDKKKSESNDLKPNEFPSLSWDGDNLHEPLETLYKHVTDEASRASRWYFENRRGMKYTGYFLRVGAIVAMAVGGVIPILSDVQKIITIHPSWATVAISFAALLAMLDRFGGFTSGWIRFMMTGQELSQILDNFRLDWQTSKVGLNSNIRPEQAQALISHCKTFLMQVHEVVRQETEMWATEFRNALKELDKASKATAKMKEVGALSIEVDNGTQCEDGWKLTIDSGSERACKGNSASVNDLTPNIHTVHIVGTIGEKTVQAEKPVSVKGGEITPVTLTLE